MSCPPLSPVVSSASLASEQALQALVTVAEALGTPEEVTARLAEVKEALVAAEEALERLEGAVVAAGPAVGPAGLDTKRLYQALGAAANTGAAELERELRRNRRRCRVLWVIRTVALVVMLVCSLLLSPDAVRAALGVTQESRLVPCLATVALVCQVALWGAGTSRRHLATAASHQRHHGHRYRCLARTAAATAKATEATEATEAVANVTLGTLEEVVSHLRALLDAVTQDLEVARGFPATARALGDAVVSLGTVMGDEEGMQTLARVLGSLPGDE